MGSPVGERGVTVWAGGVGEGSGSASVVGSENSEALQELVQQGFFPVRRSVSRGTGLVGRLRRSASDPLNGVVFQRWPYTLSLSDGSDDESASTQTSGALVPKLRGGSRTSFRWLLQTLVKERNYQKLANILCRPHCFRIALHHRDLWRELQKLPDDTLAQAWRRALSEGYKVENIPKNWIQHCLDSRKEKSLIIMVQHGLSLATPVMIYPMDGKPYRGALYSLAKCGVKAPMFFDLIMAIPSWSQLRALGDAIPSEGNTSCKGVDRLVSYLVDSPVTWAKFNKFLTRIALLRAHVEGLVTLRKREELREEYRESLAPEDLEREVNKRVATYKLSRPLIEEVERSSLAEGDLPDVSYAALKPISSLFRVAGEKLADICVRLITPRQDPKLYRLLIEEAELWHNPNNVLRGLGALRTSATNWRLLCAHLIKGVARKKIVLMRDDRLRAPEDLGGVSRMVVGKLLSSLDGTWHDYEDSITEDPAMLAWRKIMAQQSYSCHGRFEGEYVLADSSGISPEQVEDLPKDQKDLLVAVGLILAWCMSHDDVVSGTCYHPSFYRALKLLPQDVVDKIRPSELSPDCVELLSEDLRNAIAEELSPMLKKEKVLLECDAAEVSDEDFWSLMWCVVERVDIFPPDYEKNGKDRTAVLEFLDEHREACLQSVNEKLYWKQHRKKIYYLMIIAAAMRDAVRQAGCDWSKFARLDAEAMKKWIEGELDQQVVLDALKLSEQLRESTKRWLHNWLSPWPEEKAEAYLGRLGDFVEMVTGSRALPSGAELKVFLEEEEGVPRAATCFNQLTLLNCDSEEKFRSRLELAIANFKKDSTTAGMQMA